MKQLNKYNCWKAEQNGAPIVGTDKIVSGYSKREVLKYLAFTENVIYNHNDMIVKLNDGTFWCASKI